MSLVHLPGPGGTGTLCCRHHVADLVASVPESATCHACRVAMLRQALFVGGPYDMLFGSNGRTLLRYWWPGTRLDRVKNWLHGLWGLRRADPPGMVRVPAPPAPQTVTYTDVVTDGTVTLFLDRAGAYLPLGPGEKLSPEDQDGRLALLGMSARRVLCDGVDGTITDLDMCVERNPEPKVRIKVTFKPLEGTFTPFFTGKDDEA